MINSYDPTNKLAIDSKSVEDIRLLSKKDEQKALKEVAQQFEAIFLNMMLKSMREATSKGDLFNSQQTEFYTQMFDQQLAQDLSKNGLGLADIMVQQLTRTVGDKITQPKNNISHVENILHSINPDGELSSSTVGDKSRLLWSAPKPVAESTSILSSEKRVDVNDIAALKSTPITPPLSSTTNTPDDFVSTLLPHAKIASHATGIPAQFMLAQAALESGWGKHEIRHADDSPSFNLFGIKAGPSWTGDVVETMTTEYINGVPQKSIEKFRAYDSYADSFRDYANLLRNNPRYAAVLDNQDSSNFARGLQQAGYATDPKYAEKLIRIMNSDSLVNINQGI